MKKFFLSIAIIMALVSCTKHTDLPSQAGRSDCPIIIRKELKVIAVQPTTTETLIFLSNNDSVYYSANDYDNFKVGETWCK